MWRIVKRGPLWVSVNHRALDSKLHVCLGILGFSPVEACRKMECILCADQESEHHIPCSFCDIPCKASKLGRLPKSKGRANLSLNPKQ